MACKAIAVGVKRFLQSCRNAVDYFILITGLVWLALLCLLWTPIAFILKMVLPSTFAFQLGRFTIMAGFRLYLTSLRISRRCYFDLSALDILRGQGPIIIAPNHPSLLDAVFVISRLPNIVCVMKAKLMSNLLLGAGARLAGYLPSLGIRQTVNLASQALAGGSQLLLFPEGTRTTRPPLNPCVGSIALIAKQAGVPIQTVIIESNTNFLGKGWPLLRLPQMPLRYKVRLGKRFDPPEDAHAFLAELETYFKHELQQNKQEFL